MFTRIKIIDWPIKWLILWILCITLPCFGEDSALEHALVSIYAVDTDTGKVLISQNSDLSLTPASCMKVVTTAAALNLLGAESRFETHLQLDGEINDQTLHGNVYIRGGGDPCLGSDRILQNPSWEKQIQLWAGAIQKQKIRQIRGKIIADATRWEKAQAVPSWAWEDLGNYYGAGASALSFHENCYSVFFRPGAAVGQKATLLRTDPPLRHQLINEVSTGPENSGDCASIFGPELSATQWIRGTIPYGVPEFSIRGAIPDPAACCVHLLTEELKKRKIVVQGSDLRQASKKSLLHITMSPTIQEIVHWTNQKSINLYAEHLLKKMGEVKYGQGSTEAGVKAITEFWKSQKIDLSGFHMADGSGLSRKNLVTTRQLVDILVEMKKSQHFPIFLESLPEWGEAIRAKPGSMSLIKGLTGYIDNIAFAILINHFTNAQDAQQKIDSTLLQIQQLNQKTSK